MNPLSFILENKIVAIIRGIAPNKVPAIAEALCKGGIKLMEVTLNSPGALNVIEQLSKDMRDKMLIGAGTVLTTKDAADAIGAGARFLISPIVDRGLIDLTKQHGVVSIPGAFTPTEIFNAYAAGGDIIKFFPASSNINYLKDVRAPLPHIPLMPTGGITTDNIQQFQKAGAVAFGIGGALLNFKEKTGSDYLEQLTARAKKFVMAVNT